MLLYESCKTCKCTTCYNNNRCYKKESVCAQCGIFSENKYNTVYVNSCTDYVDENHPAILDRIKNLFCVNV